MLQDLRTSFYTVLALALLIPFRLSGQELSASTTSPPTPIAAGSSTTATLSVANTGDLPLRWQLDPARTSGSLIFADLENISVGLFTRSPINALRDALLARGASISLDSETLEDTDFVVTDRIIDRDLSNSLIAHISQGAGILFSGDGSHAELVLNQYGISAITHSERSATFEDLTPHPSTFFLPSFTTNTHTTDYRIDSESFAVSLIPLSSDSSFAVATTIGKGRLLAVGDDLAPLVAGSARLDFAQRSVDWLAGKTVPLSFESVQGGIVSAGGSMTVPVTINSTGLAPGIHTILIPLTSDDPVKPSIEVPVTFSVEDAQRLLVTPVEYSLGHVPIGVPITRQLTVQNTGSSSATIDSLLAEGATLKSDIVPPFDLLAGTAINLPFTFTPAELGEFLASITVGSSTIPIIATVAEPAQVEITPQAISLNHPTSQSSSASFNIQNGGPTIDLDWSVNYIDYLSGTAAEASPPGSLPGSKIGFLTRRIGSADNTNEQVAYWLRNSGAEVISLSPPLAVEALAPIDVLWVDPSSGVLTPEDINTLGDWVSAGGGILMGTETALLNPTILSTLRSHIKVLPRARVSSRDAPITLLPHPLTTGTETSSPSLTQPLEANITAPPPAREIAVLSEQEVTVAAAEVLPGGRLVVIEPGFTPGAADTYLGEFRNVSLQTVSWLRHGTPEWLGEPQPGAGTIPSGGDSAFSIAADSSALVAGTYDAEIVLASNDPSSPEARIPVSLHLAASPQITTLPLLLDFGSIPEGTRKTLDLQIINAGSGSFTITSAVSEDGAFEIASALPLTIPPRNSSSLEATYSPNDAASHFGVLTLSGSGAPIDVSVQGTATAVPLIEVSPAAIVFNVDENGETEPQSLTITNTGSAALNWSVSVPQNPNASPEWLSATGSGNIAPGASAIVAVEADPDRAPGVGTIASIEIVSDDASRSPFTIPVSIYIDGDPKQLINLIADDGLSVSSISGLTDTVSLFLFNPNTAPVTVTGLSSTDPRFTIISGTEIPPLAQKAVEIVFMPLEVGSSPAELTVVTDPPAAASDAFTIVGNSFVGPPHSLVWDPLPASTLVNTPFHATLRATDEGGNLVDSYSGTATIGVENLASEATARTTLADPTALPFPLRLERGYGYVITPDVPLLVTAVQHTGSARSVTFWSNSGEPLHVVPLAGNDSRDGLLETAVPEPFVLEAGITYRVSADQTSNRTISDFQFAYDFAHGSIESSVSSQGQNFPYLFESRVFPVGLVYKPNVTSNITVAPPQTPAFSGGVWSGNLSVSQSGEMIQLIASSSQTPVPAQAPVIAVEALGMLIVALPTQITEDIGIASGAGTLTITPAAEVETQVSLTTDAPPGFIVPETVVIPAGASSVSFDITIPGSIAPNAPQVATVTAFAHGFEMASSSTLITDDDTFEFFVDFPNAIQENSNNFRSSVFLAAPVPYEVSIRFISDQENLIKSPPDPVVIPVGQTRADVDFETVTDGIALGDTQVMITATALGAPDVSTTIIVIDSDDSGKQLALDLPEDIREGSTLSASLSRGSPFPDALFVALAPSLPDVNIPPIVMIPAGESSASFSIELLEDNLPRGIRTLTIRASTLVPGYSPTESSLEATDNDPHHFRFAPLDNEQVKDQFFPVTIFAEHSDDRPVEHFGGTAQIEVFSATGQPLPSEVQNTDFTRFSSGEASGSVAVRAVSQDASLLATDLNSGTTGESKPFSVIAPSISVSPGEISLTLAPGETATRTITVTNNGIGNLRWSTDVDALVDEGPAEVSLEEALTSLNEKFEAVTSLIPGIRDFTGGESGNSLQRVNSETGGTVEGNIITAFRGTVQQELILDYSENSVDTTSSNYQWFTRKFPGLFVFGADISSFRGLTITGESGFPNGDTVTIHRFFETIGERAFYGYARSISGAPGLTRNQLTVVIRKDLSFTRENSPRSDSDYILISNSSGSFGDARIFHLFYETARAPSERETQAVFDTFLESLIQTQWLTAVPERNQVTASGQSNEISLAIDTTGLSSSGTHDGKLRIQSNDFASSTIVVPVTLTISEIFDHLEWDPIDGIVAADSPISARLTARNQDGNLLTSFTSTADIEILQTGTVVTTIADVTIEGGVWEGELPAFPVGSGYQLRATVAIGGETTATTNEFDTVAPQIAIATLPPIQGGDRSTILWTGNIETPSPSFELQLDTDPGFSSPETFLTQNTRKDYFDLPDAEYYFRIRYVLNGSSIDHPWTETRSFIQDHTPPVLQIDGYSPDQDFVSISTLHTYTGLASDANGVTGIYLSRVPNLVATPNSDGYFTFSAQSLLPSDFVRIIAEDNADPPNSTTIGISYSPQRDLNGNFLPDDWENEFLLSSHATVVSDSDGDGFPNLLEYLSGTDPTKAEPNTIPSLSADGSTFTYRQRRELLGISLLPEISTDLKTWTPLTTRPRKTVIPDSEIDLNTFDLPAGAGNFIRLRARL